jgi:hypothetical protein
MNQKQLDDLVMFDAVKLVMNSNISVWTANAAVSSLVGTLGTNITTINTAGQNQSTNIIGVTQTKAQAKTTLITAAAILAAAGKAYATATNNASLAQACKMSKTSLKNTAEPLLAGVCQTLHDAVNPFIISMVDYGVSAATQTTLQAAITSFNVLIGSPRSTQAVGSAASQMIVVQIKNTSTLLNKQLDGLMEQYKISNSLFYDAYQTARKKVSHGHRTRVVVNISVTQAGVAAENVIVKIIVNGKTRKKVTGVDGTVRYLLLPPVDSLVTVTLTGLPTQSKTLNVATAQTVDMVFDFTSGGAGPVNPNNTGSTH